MDWINDLAPHWIWLALGVFLAAAEIAVPGTFLIWMAGAAIITGIAAWLLPIGIFVQIMLFAALAIAAVFLGRRYLRDNPIEAFDPKMNDRGARIMGETVVVVTAIQGGTGRVRLGDSEWLAKGADAAPGTRLRIAGHDGVVLIVEPIA